MHLPSVGGTLRRLPHASSRPVATPCAPLVQRWRRSNSSIVAGAASTSSNADGPSGSDGGQWWDQLKRGSIIGPDAGGSLGLGPDGSEGQTGSLAEMLLGTKGYAQMEAADREEAQRIWNAMRASARRRYQNGEMPDWFDPAWLLQEEAPINRMLRLQRGQPEGRGGDGASSSGGGGGSSGNGGNGGSGGGWGGFWQEDDPYWPLRDTGDHPMRWWTFGFAALLALGGVVTHAMRGTPESLFVGGVVGATLSMCAMAMSDMSEWGYGPLAVKVAWATCALLAAKEFFFGWSHRPVPPSCRPGNQWPWTSGTDAASIPSRLGGCGMASLAMCLLYMWTGMTELDEWALPANPGSVYKNGDVVYKHLVAKRWGYGNAPMRT